VYCKKYLDLAMSEVGKAIGLAILIFGIISALGLLVWGWNLSSAFWSSD
jgi:hypothetical protein